MLLPSYTAGIIETILDTRAYPYVRWLGYRLPAITGMNFWIRLPVSTSPV